MSRSTMSFSEEKEKYLNMSLDEKRKLYKHGSDYVTLEDIPTWKESAPQKADSTLESDFVKDLELSQKVSLFKGDITTLEIDAIVNAANESLRGGGGVDGSIHRAAGGFLLAECISLSGCPTGEAKITGGYSLPAKYIIHTVGPRGEHPELLKAAYRNSLIVAKENGIRSIAFPCISTGVYGYPNENAAHVALGVVREFLEQNKSSFDRVIFCLFLSVDVEVYNTLMHKYFPF